MSSIQFFNSIGGLIGSIINKVESTGTGTAAWMWPVCVQGFFPLIMVCGLWTVPLSPRWLISKGRHDEAVRVLKLVRPTGEARECEEEVMVLEEALHQVQDKGPWKDIFIGTNLRRTTIAGVVFCYAQVSGDAV